ncbi:hypothetical protein OCU04_001185 [Sclerotinia nivalis]|uniref:Fungal STAND N-terminal Goodbye domain-containing protein n=1 Tax=Sclerotinia nivalis TaxID=352851 RepID=A0A9X0AY75_9HELO|nr:hypothetical protein OCU04_001185 [Sclerotinia nivalis]
MSETPNSQAVQNTNTKSTKELWDDAIKECVQEHGIDVQKLSVDLDFEEEGDGVDEAVALFRNKRHPNDRKDKTIQAIKGFLNSLDSITGFIKEHVSGTSATPVQLVTGVVSHMIKATKDVSEDLDLINETFGSIHNASKDIAQLNHLSWKEDKFTTTAVEIFVTLFGFCWFTKDIFRKYSRRYKSTLVLMQFRESAVIKVVAISESIYLKLDDVLDAVKDGNEFKSSDFQVYWDNLSEKIKEIFKKQKFNFEGMSLIEKQTNKVKAQIVPGTSSWILNHTMYKGMDICGRPKNTISSCPRCYWFGKVFLHLLLLPAASKDSSFKSISLGSFRIEKTTGDEVAKYLWDEMIVKNFARNLEPRRNLYILLDGVENISSGNVEAQKMVEILQTLNCAATGIQIMMTHIPWIGKSQETDTKSPTTFTARGTSQAQAGFGPRNPYHVDLDGVGVQQKESLKKDLKLIIEYRIKNSKNLKGFKEKSIVDIKNDLMSINWPKETGARSMVDLVLSLIEQSGDDEAAARETLNNLKALDITVELLYRPIIEMVLEGRSQGEIRSIKKLFSWCTYAMQFIKCSSAPANLEIRSLFGGI